MEHYDVLYENENFMSTFERARDTLRGFVKSNEKMYVSCIYLCFIYPYTDAQGAQQGLFVYLVDSAEEDDACPPGWLDPLYDRNKGLLNDQTLGLPAYSTNTKEYGYLITSGSYLKGTELGYVCTDISMAAVRKTQSDRIVRLFIYMTITVICLAIAGVLVVYFIFSRPLRRITNAAKSFNNNDPKQSHAIFENLHVKTYDELTELYNSIMAMENGVVERFDELIKLNQDLSASKLQTAKMTALANRDSLTGVGSKIAYSIEVEKLDDKIKDKQKVAFGIAMIDLNYLKVTNDEFGHYAGDEALVKLANIICLTFKHSPVFRIGGDEFVVILTNNDYREAKKLIEEFKERIQDSAANAKLQEYERVSAAIGFAKYDASIDKCVEDVFKRADTQMYQCKRDMKE